MLTHRLCVISIAMALCCATAAAETGDKDKARALYKEGMQHYNLGEYAEALQAFKGAYRAFEEPSFLFNVGQCERVLGQKLEAVRSYRAFLREAKDVDPATRTKVEQIIEGLEKALKEEQAAKAQPPQDPMHAPPTVTEAKPTTTQQPAIVAAPAPTTESKPASRAKKTPVYKRWWLWTAVGIVVAGGIAAGLAVGLTSQPVSYPSATTAGGTLRF